MAAEPLVVPSEPSYLFSVIVPAYGDPEGLYRTLANLSIQSCDADGNYVPREIIVIGDGHEKATEKCCKEVFKQLRKVNHIKLDYLYTDRHMGNGNIPRRIGLRRATGVWTMFIDSGTALAYDAFNSLATAVLKFPDAKFITWEMWQMLDPVCIVSKAEAIVYADRSNGLPYIFPGCGTAVRRDIAQLIEWPNTHASDWAYFSQLWDKLYLKEDGTRGDTEEVINKDVVIIPWALTCAYGNKSQRKWRDLIDPSRLEELGWTKGWNQRQEALLKKEQNGEQRPDTESLPRAEDTQPTTL